MAIFDQDFFDTLTDKLAATGRVISEKAKEVTDSAKTSLQIAQEEKNLRAAYRQLGEYIYEKSGIEPDGGMAPFFAMIEDVKEKLEQLKNGQEKTCNCGNDGGCDDDCDCGCDGDCDCDCDGDCEQEEVSEVEVAPEQESAERVCPKCRSVVSSQLIYCPKCGDKLK